MTGVRAPRPSRSKRAPSSWAVDWTYFASVMMLLIGIFLAIAGLIAGVDRARSQRRLLTSAVA